MKVIQNNESSVLWDLGPGKTYVDSPVSKPQKSSICWYWAGCRIRQRYGKGSTDKRRKYEKILSTYRKTDDRINLMRQCCTALLEDKIEALSSQATKQFALNFFSRHFNEKPEYKKQEQQKFAQNYLKVFSFKQEIENAKDALNALGIKDITKGVLFFRNEAVKMSEFDSLSLEKQVPLLHKAVLRTCHKMLGIEASLFHPAEGCEGLIATLKKEGPLMFHGNFGFPFHTAEPKLSKHTVGGTPLYVFPKYSFDESLDKMHTIVVIGAESQKTQNVVYYVDQAAHEKGLNADERPKTFVMSYDLFRRKLFNANCEFYEIAGVKTWTNIPGPYALKGNLQLKF